MPTALQKQLVAKRDLKLLQIDEEIKNKKNLILKKKKELEKRKADNTYLDTIFGDYNQFHEYAIEQKQKEYRAMNLLKEYIADLVKTEKLLDNQLRTAKYDQKEVISEIAKIKEEIVDLGVLTGDKR
jgi:ssDNA-binding Zn-finger/Zn-ribbon topoisomerase 1